MAAGRAKKRVINAAVARRKKGEAIRSASPFLRPDPRERFVLSYLNRTQLNYWKSLSPQKQRRVLEEIERKLARKQRPLTGETGEVKEIAFAAGKRRPAGSGTRARSDDTALRTVTDGVLRRSRSVLRIQSARRGALRLVEEPGEAGKKTKQSPFETRNALTIAVRKKELPGRAKQRLPGREESGAAGRNTAKGYASRVTLTRQRARSPSLQPSTKVHVHSFDGRWEGPKMRSRQRDEMLRTVKRSRIRRLDGNFEKETDFPVEGVSSNAPALETQGVPVRKRKVSPDGRGHQTDRSAQRREQKGAVPAALSTSPVLSQGAVSEKKETVKNKPLLSKTIEEAKKEALTEQGQRHEEAENAARTSSYPLTIHDAAKEAPGLSDRSVILDKDDLSEESNYTPTLNTGASSGSRYFSFRQRRREKQQAARFQKEFALLLISRIEKDLRKDEAVRQAQKSGQINASVSELTGKTGRGAVRTPAIPLRVAVSMMAKRLRREAARRLKEAAASLIRYAVSFGAPVFAVTIIVMLLSSILMVGTIRQSARGSGLGYLIVEEAKKHLGLPYVYGGTSLTDGCDCSGFVWAIYNLFGYNLPRTAGAQYSYGRKVGSDPSEWQLGDLIYYSKTGTVQSGGGRAEHIVIYIGGGQVISCGPVAIYNWDYRSDYYGTCRIIPDEAAEGDFSGSTNEEICWNFFISQGFSEAATAGILGNMYVESGGTFDPSIHQYGGGPGRGLCQWEESYSGGSGRYNNLAAFAEGLGKSWDDITAQLQFVCHELDTGLMNPYFARFGGVEAFKNSDDPATATYVFLCGFEYCGDPGESFLEANFALSTRVSHANWAYETYQ